MQSALAWASGNNACHAARRAAAEQMHKAHGGFMSALFEYGRANQPLPIAAPSSCFAGLRLAITVRWHRSLVAARLRPAGTLKSAGKPNHIRTAPVIEACPRCRRFAQTLECHIARS